MAIEKSKVYCYVGPHDLRQLPGKSSDRTQILRLSDVLVWVNKTRQEVERDRSVTATFIVDTSGQLWIADRYSEHVVCAAGQPVLAAGEITFVIQYQHISVSEVTNQSTGYCPDPEAWSEIAAALDKLGLEHPPCLTTAYIFRRCDQCGAINIVKESFFVCGVCDAILSPDWNF